MIKRGVLEIQIRSYKDGLNYVLVGPLHQLIHTFGLEI